MREKNKILSFQLRKNVILVKEMVPSPVLHLIDVQHVEVMAK